MEISHQPSIGLSQLPPLIHRGFHWDHYMTPTPKQCTMLSGSIPSPQKIAIDFSVKYEISPQKMGSI